MNEFLNQQDERLAYSQQMMQEAQRELTRTVRGDKASRAGHIDYGDQLTMEMAQLPLRKLNLKDLLLFMVQALNRWDATFVVAAFLQAV